MGTSKEIKLVVSDKNDRNQNNMNLYKSNDSSSISECCILLEINREDLPDVLKKINSSSERVQLIRARLETLLEEDKASFEACQTVEQYENYMSTWADGLYHDKAQVAIDKLKKKAEELAYYQRHKNSICGLKSYIKRYPEGEYIPEAQVCLKKKRKIRKICNIILLIIALIVAVIVCLLNYHPVSFLNVPDVISFEKRGGENRIRIYTDAIDSNVEVLAASDWIRVDKTHDSWSVIAVPNTEAARSASVTVKSYSSFFGKQFDCIIRTIKLSQNSGLPTFLETNISKVVFDKYGKCSSSDIIAKTDGCELQISNSSSWLDINKDIKEDGDNTVASIKLSTGINKGNTKTADLVISCKNYVKHIIVTQESGLSTYFRLGKTSITAGEDGSGYSSYYPIDIFTDGTSWSVKSAPSWVTTEATDKLLKVYIGANSGKNKRGTITVMSNNGDTRDISVFQYGDPSNFRAAKSTIRFGTDSDYEYVTIHNDSRKSLSVSENESWITISVIDKNEIKISCFRNYDDPPRSGIVYVNCGGEQLSISVRQEGWETCEYCGGDGEASCPNIFRSGWMVGNHAYSYDWVNGQHVLRDVYTVWDPWTGIPIPRADINLCPDCGGNGRVNCSKCKEGKIKKSY